MLFHQRFIVPTGICHAIFILIVCLVTFAPQLLMLDFSSPCCDFNVYHAPEMISSGSNIFEYLANIYPKSSFWNDYPQFGKIDPMTGALAPTWLVLNAFLSGAINPAQLMLVHSLIIIYLISMAFYLVLFELGRDPKSIILTVVLILSPTFISSYFIGPVHILGILSAITCVLGFLYINNGKQFQGNLMLAVSILIGVFGYQFYISVIAPLLVVVTFLIEDLTINIKKYLTINMVFPIIAVVATLPFVYVANSTYNDSYRSELASDFQWVVSNIPSALQYLKMLLSLHQLSYEQNISGGENIFFSSVCIWYLVFVYDWTSNNKNKIRDWSVLLIIFTFSFGVYSPLNFALYSFWPFFAKFRSAHYMHFVFLFAIFLIISREIKSKQNLPIPFIIIVSLMSIIIISIILYFEATKKNIGIYLTIISPFVAYLMCKSISTKIGYALNLLAAFCLAILTNSIITTSSQSLSISNIVKDISTISKSIIDYGYRENCNTYSESSNAYRYLSKHNGVRSKYSYDPLPRSINFKEINFLNSTIEQLIEDNIQFIVTSEVNFSASRYFDLIDSFYDVSVNYQGLYIKRAPIVHLYSIKHEYMTRLSCMDEPISLGIPSLHHFDVVRNRDNKMAEIIVPTYLLLAPTLVFIFFMAVFLYKIKIKKLLYKFSKKI